MRVLGSDTQTADAAGTVTAVVKPPTGQSWLVDHVSVQSNSALPSIGNLFVKQSFIAGTSSANLDTADGSVVVLNDHEEMTFTWTGADAGASCSLTLIGQQVPRPSIT